MTTITIPIPEHVLWPVLGIAAFLLVVWLIYGLGPRTGLKTPWLDQLREDLGLKKMDGGLFAISLLLYGAVAISLIAGLLLLIWSTITSEWPNTEDKQREALFHILRLAGLTTVLGAVIALPITISRLRLSEKQTATAEESLFNEKINAASNDLHARRQVTRYDNGKAFDIWQDDVTKRNSAIDRLEGLSHEYKENYGAAERVARLLSVYTRELSREYKAIGPPSDATTESVRKWAEELKYARSDMEKAVQTLRRIRPYVEDKNASQAFDLTEANLQGFRLARGDLRSANLPRAHLEGTKLFQTTLQGANLKAAYLQGANLMGTNLHEADLSDANLWGADLSAANLQGAYLFNATLTQANLAGTKLKDAVLSGAELSNANVRNTDLYKADLQKANLVGANLQGAVLDHVNLREADLRETNLENTQLFDVKLEGAKDLHAAHFRGASVRSVDFAEASEIASQIDHIYGDASVKLPNGEQPGDPGWPDHWCQSKEPLGFEEFNKLWRAWQDGLRPLWSDPN